MSLSARMSSLIALFVAMFALAGCDQRPSDFLASGRAGLEKSDFQTAVIQFKNAVEKDPGNPEARYLLGYALGKTGDLPGAEAQVRKAIELGYDQNVARPALIEVLTSLGDSKNALAEAEQLELLTLPEAKAEVMALKGDVLFSEKRVDDAAAAYTAALAVDPKNSTALAGRARLLLWKDEYEKSQAIADEVLARSPDDLRALLIRASVLQRTGKMTESIAVLDRVVSLNPIHFFAYTSLVPALLSTRDIPGAKARLAQLQKAAPKALPTHYLEGLVAYSEKDLDTARDRVRQVLKVVPDHTRGLLLGGMVESDLGNHALAMRHLERLVRLVPAEPVARRLLARAYLATGQVDRARVEISEALKLVADDSEALRLAGEVAFADRDYRAAVDFFRRAAGGDGKNAALLVRLGEARLFAGDADQGLRDLEVARAMTGGRVMSDAALVAYHLSRKEFPKALAMARSVADDQPEDAAAQQTLATASRAAKDYASARQALEKLSRLTRDGFSATRQLAEIDVIEGKPDAAKARIRSLLDREPRNEDASLLLASLAGRTGEPRDSILGILDAAVAADPMAGRARLEKMRQHLAAGETALALEAAQQAISVLGEEPSYLLMLAKAQAAAKEYTQAITTYGKLSRLAPNSRIPYMGQVEIHAAEQNWKAARDAAVRAVAAAPDDISARLVLVDTGIRAGMHEQAVRDAVAIQTKWPNAAAGYTAESHVHLARKRTAEAEAALRKGLSRIRDSALVTRMAALYSSQGRKADGDRFLERWFAEHPDDIATLDALGRAALEARDYAAAERWYRKAVEAKPDNAALLNNLAWTLGKTKNPEAMTIARRAVEVDPKAIQFQATLGAVLLALGDPGAAETVLRKAIEVQPALSWAHVHLGRALLAQGKKDEAKRALEAAKKLSGLSAVREELDELEKGLAI